MPRRLHCAPTRGRPLWRRRAVDRGSTVHLGAAPTPLRQPYRRWHVVVPGARRRRPGSTHGADCPRRTRSPSRPAARAIGRLAADLARHASRGAGGSSCSSARPRRQPSCCWAGSEHVTQDAVSAAGGSCRIPCRRLGAALASGQRRPPEGRSTGRPRRAGGARPSVGAEIGTSDAWASARRSDAVRDQGDRIGRALRGALARPASATVAHLAEPSRSRATATPRPGSATADREVHGRRGRPAFGTHVPAGHTLVRNPSDASERRDACPQPWWSGPSGAMRARAS